MQIAEQEVRVRERQGGCWAPGTPTQGQGSCTRHTRRGPMWPTATARGGSFRVLKNWGFPSEGKCARYHATWGPECDWHIPSNEDSARTRLHNTAVHTATWRPSAQGDKWDSDKVSQEWDWAGPSPHGTLRSVTACGHRLGLCLLWPVPSVVT